MKMIKISVMALAISLMSFSTNHTSGISTEIKTNAKSIIWKSETIDVGEIPQGVPKAIEFKFKNTSKDAIVIVSAQGSCGCTSTDFPKTPILPRASGKITATFNAASKGVFTKTVTVKIASEELPVLLTFKGIVS